MQTQVARPGFKAEPAGLRAAAADAKLVSGGPVATGPVEPRHGRPNMDLHKIYEYALAREREGRDFFRRHADRMAHAAAAGAFRAHVLFQRPHKRAAKVDKNEPV
jgi:hypothetical protein